MPASIWPFGRRPTPPPPTPFAEMGERVGERLNAAFRIPAVTPSREEAPMTDQQYDPHTEPEGWAEAVADRDRLHPAASPDERAAPPGYTAEHAEPDTEVLDTREDCPHCHGTGKVLTTSDHLRNSLALLGDDPEVHDQVIAQFYQRLLWDAPDLAALFPPDLIERGPEADPRGKMQRDKLFKAIVALGTSYDRDSPQAMEVLDTHLATYGRAHANFARPDGSTRGATLAEYNAVKIALFDTLHEVAGDAWRPEYDVAWSEAFDYAAGEMLHAQNHTDLKHARYPRQER